MFHSRLELYFLVSSLLAVNGSPVSQPEILRGPYGKITSPNIPSENFNKVRKEWIVRVREGYHIKFRFTAFDVKDSYEEEREPCISNYVLVTEGTKTISRLCRNAEEDPRTYDWFYTEGNESRFVFESNYSTEGRSLTSFTAHYVEEDIDECAELKCNVQQTLEDCDEPIVCNHFCINIPGSYYCSCQSGYELHSNQHTCVVKSCGRPENLLSVNFSHILDFDSKRFEYSEEVTVECDPWYRMIAGGATWRCEDSKQWELKSRPKTSNPPLNLPKCRPKCGLSVAKQDAFATQLFGAKKVKKQESWPWMAFVDLGGGRKGNEYCGGTLVDEKTVVTAAHCIYSLMDDDPVFVWVGLLNRKNDTLASYTQKFRVASREYEPSFGGSGHRSGYNYDGNIAVLKLDRPVDFSDYVHPICIPTAEVQTKILADYGVGRKKAVVVGWGRTSDNWNTFSDDLLRIKIPFVNHGICRQAFQRELPYHDNLITENMICAGFTGGRKEACQGDSGGPLMTKYDGRWYLTGIVSFGDTNICGRSRSYGVYTDVSKYDGFIGAMLEGR